MKKEDKRTQVMAEVGKGISMILQIGINMMVPIFLCLLIGVKLDQYFETKFLTVIFVLLGILAGFKSVYSLTKSFYKKKH